jgi:hypothetical protein
MYLILGIILILTLGVGVLIVIDEYRTRKELYKAERRNAAWINEAKSSRS